MLNPKASSRVWLSWSVKDQQKKDQRLLSGFAFCIYGVWILEEANRDWDKGEQVDEYEEAAPVNKIWKKVSGKKLCMIWKQVGIEKTVAQIVLGF